MRARGMSTKQHRKSSDAAGKAPRRRLSHTSSPQSPYGSQRALHCVPCSCSLLWPRQWGCHHRCEAQEPEVSARAVRVLARGAAGGPGHDHTGFVTANISVCTGGKPGARAGKHPVRDPEGVLAWTPCEIGAGRVIRYGGGVYVCFLWCRVLKALRAMNANRQRPFTEFYDACCSSIVCR
jgi:hypothetical protein